MSATAAPAIKPASVVPARAAASDARSTPSSEHAFDRRLDAARQQRRHDHAPAPEDVHAKPAHASPPADGKDAPAAAKVVKTTDPASDAAAAAAMLALLGQAGPAVAPVAATEADALAAAGPRGALAALSATGEPKADDHALDALLNGVAGAPSIASPTAALAGSATAITDLLPGVSMLKDDRAAALADLATQAAAINAPAPGNLAGPVGAHLLNVASPVGTSAFAHDLGLQITWLGKQELKEARIKLHPEDLGALDVKITMTHDRVDLTFIAQHPATVHAVQQSLAHLDAMLAQHGMTLGHADVSQQQRGDSHSERSGGSGRVSQADEASVAALTPINCPAPTLLDTFA